MVNRMLMRRLGINEVLENGTSLMGISRAPNGESGITAMLAVTDEGFVEIGVSEWQRDLRSDIGDDESFDGALVVGADHGADHVQVLSATFDPDGRLIEGSLNGAATDDVDRIVVEFMTKTAPISMVPMVEPEEGAS